MGKMKRLSMSKALNSAIDRAMEEDARVINIGEDIGLMGGSFGVTAGLMDKYGANRVIDTPISEMMYVSASVGAAACVFAPLRR